MKRILVVGILTIVAAQAVVAQDSVKLKNGDNLNGTLGTVAGGTLTLKTPYSKEVKVDWAEVSGVDMQAPARIVLTSGEVVEGQLVTRNGALYLDGPGGARQINPEDIESVGVPEVTWAGLVGATVLGTAGNSRNLALGVKGELARLTKTNRFSLGVRGDYQEREQESTVQSAFGRIRFDHQLTDTWFIGVFDEVEHDYFKDIRIRNRIGGGPGYRFINTPTMQLSALVGLAHTYTTYRHQSDDSFVAAVISESFAWHISESQLLYQLLDIYPSLQNSSDFTLRAEAGFRQTVAAGLFLDVGVIDDYNNNPASGRKSNDFRYQLSLGYLW